MPIEASLKALLSTYNAILPKVEKSLLSLPKGSLITSLSNGRQQFYYSEDHSKDNRTYIKKSKTDLISKLATKEYFQNIEKNVKPQKKLIEDFLQRFDEKALLKAYDQMPTSKQDYCEPFEIPEHLFVEKWEKKMKYLISQDTVWQAKHTEGRFGISEAGDMSQSREVGLITERGEQVRSKSEKIIADKLDRLGIPYFYEVPLLLNDSKVFHPDFTILNVNTRKTIYWEHFGLTEDPQYVRHMIEKIELYESNGLIPGQDLIFTYENEKMNTSLITTLITKYGLVKERE